MRLNGQRIPQSALMMDVMPSVRSAKDGRYKFAADRRTVDDIMTDSKKLKQDMLDFERKLDAQKPPSERKACDEQFEAVADIIRSMQS